MERKVPNWLKCGGNSHTEPRALSTEPKQHLIFVISDGSGPGDGGDGSDQCGLFKHLLDWGQETRSICPSGNSTASIGQRIALHGRPRRIGCARARHHHE